MDCKKASQSQRPPWAAQATSHTVGNQTPALGSEGMLIFPRQNVGFFSTVVNAYNHHYNLRTCPEDWWYTIIQKVAVAVDTHAKKVMIYTRDNEHNCPKHNFISLTKTTSCSTLYSRGPKTASDRFL